MPRRNKPKACGCGCGQMTGGGTFRPGHDSKVLSAILDHIDGDVLDLKALVEEHTNKVVTINHEEK